LGRSRGGFSTKLHVLVDALGNPLKFLLTSGAAGDNPQAIPLLDGVQADEVVADRGYDADKTIAYIEDEMHAVATIPPKKSRVAPRACDYAAYKERHLVECFIGTLKYFRRVFARFDKYARRYLAFVHFASIFTWLK
jgi:transposase